MKMSFSKVITKKWQSHLEVWLAKRHLHGWLLARPNIYIYIFDLYMFDKMTARQYNDSTKHRMIP